MRFTISVGLWHPGICSFVLLITLVNLAACGAATSAIPTPETLVQPTPFPKTAQTITPDVRTRWLAGQPCAPPCWEGITPGKTRVDEVVALLNRHPMVTHIEIYRPLLGGDGQVSWRWNGVDEGSGMIGFPQIDPQVAADSQDATNPIIEWIGISFPKTFTLAEIRSAYGDPSHVAPVFFDGDTAHVGRTRFFELSLIYLPQGFLVQTERTFESAPKISPNMSLTNSVFFFSITPADPAAIPASVQHLVNASPVPWQGFRDFGFYCQQVPPANDPPNDGPYRCPNVSSTLPERSVVPSAVPPLPSAVPSP